MASLGVLVIVLLASASCRRWIMEAAPGKADTETVMAESKRMMDVSCILRNCGGIKLREDVRDRHQVLLQVTH